MKRLRLVVLVLALLGALAAYYYHVESAVRVETVQFKSALDGRLRRAQARTEAPGGLRARGLDEWRARRGLAHGRRLDQADLRRAGQRRARRERPAATRARVPRSSARASPLPLPRLRGQRPM